MHPEATDLLAALRSRQAFGAPLPRIPQSPQAIASDNLIEKALRTWDADRTRGIRYVERATQFPYDHHERAFPGLWAAHMALFSDVCDAVEESASDDRRWLDSALELLSVAEDAARIDLADVLRTIADDYQLSKREAADIRAACAGIPEPEDPVDPTLATGVVRDRALAVVGVTAEYRASRGSARDG
ncbi:hypothetical protein [Humibacter sp.]|uniref:hypothetical protein n=1 Tax=Humibacter sp. TaxID=1940291 RepID=UPI003F821580